MRILRLIPYFDDGFGGPVNHAKMLTEELERAGHETVIFTSNLADKSGDVSPSLANGFDVRAFPVSWSVGDYFYTPGMKAALKAEEFDVIHAHCYRNYQADLAAWISRRAGKPLVFTAHGTLPKLPILKDRLLKGFYDAFARSKVLKSSSKVVALSLREMNQYRQMDVPHEKIVRIDHGVDSNLFRPMKAGVTAHGLGSGSDPTILYVGRIHRRKGLEYLVRAFREVLEEFPESKLVICGPDYGYKERLLRFIDATSTTDSVVFTGSLAHRDMPAMYNASNVVVLPSQLETFGHVLAEAASCGKPVVATKWGWAAEFFESGKDALLVERYGDVPSLANALLTLVRDPGLNNRLGRAAREKVLRRLSWEACASAHRVTYEHLLNGPSSSHPSV